MKFFIMPSIIFAILFLWSPPFFEQYGIIGQLCIALLISVFGGMALGLAFVGVIALIVGIAAILDEMGKKK